MKGFCLTSLGGKQTGTCAQEIQRIKYLFKVKVFVIYYWVIPFPWANMHNFPVSYWEMINRKHCIYFVENKIKFTVSYWENWKILRKQTLLYRQIKYVKQYKMKRLIQGLF